MSCCFDFFFSRLRGKVARGVGWRRPLARRNNIRHSGKSRNPVSLLCSVRHPCLFSAPLPGARVTSLCLAKEKSPRERPPREHVLSTSLCSGCASGRRGSPKAHPCACGELARILRAILRTDPSSARRVRGAPLGALPARLVGRSECTGFTPNQAWVAVVEAGFFRGPCAAVRAGRSGPQGGRKGLRPLAAAPGMARRQARPARTDFSSMEGRKTQHRGGLLFGDFLLAKQEKVTRARGTRTEKDMDVAKKTSPARGGARNRGGNVIPPRLRRSRCARVRFAPPLPGEGGNFAIGQHGPAQ